MTVIVRFGCYKNSQFFAVVFFLVVSQCNMSCETELERLHVFEESLGCFRSHWIVCEGEPSFKAIKK